MPSPNTRHLLAGHDPRRVRAPLSPQQVALRIVSSIRLHARHGITRQPRDYTDREETLTAVYRLLEGETSGA